MDIKDCIVISSILGFLTIVVVLVIIINSKRHVLIHNTPNEKPGILPKDKPLPDAGKNLFCSFVVNIFVNVNVQENTLIFKRGKSPILTYFPNESSIEISTLTDINKTHKIHVKNILYPNKWTRLIISYSKRNVDVYNNGILVQSNKLPNVPILNSGPIYFDANQKNLLIQYFEYTNFAFNEISAKFWNKYMINNNPKFPNEPKEKKPKLKIKNFKQQNVCKFP
tara:strand:+ start:2824 stop:3495 length:672 start_codon:yes stop_codon:yes gene_type:complete